jgi:hypothetical protein
MSNTSTLLDRFLLAALLFVLVWLPLPLGSNRDWAIGLFVLLMGGLASLWAIGQLRGALPPFKQSKSVKAALPLLSLLLLAQAWVAVQWLAGLSMDNGATFQHLMLGLAYSLLFLLVVSLCHTRKRLSLLLGTLVVSGTLQTF